MKVEIKPSKLEGIVEAPLSKSHAHRLLIASFLSGENFRIDPLSSGTDLLATRECLDTLREAKGKDLVLLNCRESGSTLRFLLPLALLSAKEVGFTGSSRLLERGICVYDEVLSPKGVRIRCDSDRILLSGRLSPGEFCLRGDESSQYISGLLFALPLLHGDSSIRVTTHLESRPYVDMTLSVLRDFGIQVTETEPGNFVVPGNQHYRSGNFSVEGDWSNAAPFLALDRLLGGIRVCGLNEASVQADRVCPRLLDILSGDSPTVDLTDCPDLAPVLFAYAAMKNGGTFYGTSRLRLKESDRARSMRDELFKCGIKTEISDDHVNILKGNIHVPSLPFSSHNDHRVVMALSVLCLCLGGEIENAEAIRKSYPAFFTSLRSLGAKITILSDREDEI